MGREGDRQGDLIVTWSEMPRSPGHVFYDRLQEVLIAGGFDHFVETACPSYYALKLGAPSLPPGRYFRMHMVGYFEGIASERGIAWRCSDSYSLRDFLRLEHRGAASFLAIEDPRASDARGARARLRLGVEARGRARPGQRQADRC